MMPNVRLKPDSMVVNSCGGVWCVSSRNLHNYYFCILQYDDGVRFNTGPQMTYWISVRNLRQIKYLHFTSTRQKVKFAFGLTI